MSAPWPDVTECHGHPAGHVHCPQCAGGHDHDWIPATRGPDGRWVALNRSLWNVAERVLPDEDGIVAVRCSVCGGRKCDVPGCVERRHHLSPHLMTTGELRRVGA